MSCSYEDCDFECYESHDECIFHCGKSDWITPARKLWKDRKVKEFWAEIRSKKRGLENQFTGFKFPKFEDHPCDLVFEFGRYGTRENGCIDNTNFGFRGEYGHYYSLLPNASFKDAFF